MKRTVFLLCDDCKNILMSNNKVVGDKILVCGQGCGNQLRSISKEEAIEYFQQKVENEKRF